jgi:hypothetical protein
MFRSLICIMLVVCLSGQPAIYPPESSADVSAITDFDVAYRLRGNPVFWDAWIFRAYTKEA